MPDGNNVSPGPGGGGKHPVTGTVTDNQQIPLAGVSVVVKGTQTGAVTGANGNYSINAADNAVLQFSFIGYKPQEVAISNRTTVDIVLQEEATALDESSS